MPEPDQKGGPDLISFADMPERLEQAQLKRVSATRCRQLAEQDPDWPIPMDEAPKIGRVRLFDWRVLEPYFRNRKSRQGQRPDRLKRKQEDVSDEPASDGSGGDPGR